MFQEVPKMCHSRFIRDTTEHKAEELSLWQHRADFYPPKLALKKKKTALLASLEATLYWDKCLQWEKGNLISESVQENPAHTGHASPGKSRAFYSNQTHFNNETLHACAVNHRLAFNIETLACWKPLWVFWIKSSNPCSHVCNLSTIQQHRNS